MALPLFCALFLFAGALFAQTVQGTVINAVASKGIAGVEVALERDGEIAYETLTDERGRFQIAAVKEGIYAIVLGANGYWPAKPAEDQPIHVRAGSPSVGIERQMVPSPKLSGRVIDGRGDPVPGASIELRDPGGFRLAAETDDKGTFGLEALWPGNYTLAAVAPRDWKAPTPDGERPLAWARTWYPGAVLRPGAATIAIASGTDLPEIQIKLAAVPTHRIHGTITALKDVPASRATIFLSDADSAPQALSTNADSDGVFEFSGVTDGEWRLFAAMEHDGVVLTATEWVHVAGNEIAGVRLHFRPSFSLSGHIILETPEGTRAPRLPMVRLVPHGGPNFAPGHPGDLPIGSPDSSGTFVIPNLFPGVYQILPAQTKPPYYLDSVRLGDTEVLGQEIDLPSLAPLTISYKSHGGIVRGRVESCVSGWVFLIPENYTPATDPRVVGQIVRHEACHGDGRFEFGAIRPGEYYAVAVASVPGYRPEPMIDWHSNLIAQATRVTVRAGDSTMVELRIVRPE